MEPELIAGIEPRGAPGRRTSVWLVGTAFALFGLVFGVWQVALPDLQRTLDLSGGALGRALTAGFLASFPVALLGGRLSDRWGERRLIAVGAMLMALAFGGLMVVRSYGALLLLLFIFFGASGAYDVGITAAALANEHAGGQGRLAYYHAAFSAASGAGALLGGGLVALGVPYLYLYGGLAVALGVLTVPALRLGAGPAAASTPTAASSETAASAPALGLGVWRLPGLAALAGIAALAYLTEGALEDWMAIYLRGPLGLSPAVGAVGLGVIHGSLLLGRLATGRLSHRLDRRRLMTGGGLLTVLGMGLALATAWPPLVLAGLAVTGVALAGLAPTAFTLGGNRAPAHMGEVSAALTTVGYLGFLIGPVVIGGLSDSIGLRAALSTLILAGALIITLSALVREPRAPAAGR
ncbi:MAG: MFS transporter [Anaerolineales bacterium]|nr:MFS transporter [Anaerolineales bacterium]